MTGVAVANEERGLIYPLVSLDTKEDGIHALVLKDPHTSEDFSLVVPEARRSGMDKIKPWLVGLGYNIGKVA